jgi:hypothetical protein
MFFDPKAASSPTMRALVAAHEGLTTPDSEDWVVLPLGDSVALTCLQESRDESGRVAVHIASGVVPVSEIKKTIEGLPVKNHLGCITVTLQSDGEKHGALDLLVWLKGKAKEKHFSLASMIGPASKTIRNHRGSGRGVPFIKIEGAVRYRVQDVLAYENSRVRRSISDRGDVQ